MGQIFIVRIYFACNKVHIQLLHFILKFQHQYIHMYKKISKLCQYQLIEFLASAYLRSQK